MHRLFSYTIFMLLIGLMSPTVQADLVELDNGSKIVGDIQKIFNGRLLIKTDFAGELAIYMDRVVSFSSDIPMFVALPSDNKLYGTVQYDRQQIQVNTLDGAVRVEKPDLVAVWQKGMPDPLLPPPRKWKYEVGMDIAGKTGNTERISTGGKIKAALEGMGDELIFYLTGMYDKKNGEKSDDEIIGGIDFERDLTKRLSWYARVELENDEIEGIELRTTAATGYSYYLLRDTNHELRTRTGVLYRHESYVDWISNSTLGLDFGIYHRYQLNDWCKLITGITYTPSIEDFSDYLISHESAFEVPLWKSNLWKVQMGVTNKYSSITTEDKEKLDTTYFTRLVFRWE